MITCEGDKFIVARWTFDANLESLREDGINTVGDEELVKLGDVAVLRNTKEVNVLAEQVKKQVEEFYIVAMDKEDIFPFVYTWHIGGTHKDIDCPTWIVLFRGEDEVCTVWFDLIDPLTA